MDYCAAYMFECQSMNYDLALLDVIRTEGRDHESL